jgi:hypothetical protein
MNNDAGSSSSSRCSRCSNKITGHGSCPLWPVFDCSSCSRLASDLRGSAIQSRYTPQEQHPYPAGSIRTDA